MTRFSKMAAAFAALALMAGASAASAQSYGFTQSGQAVTARGRLVQNLLMPGPIETTCDVEAYGVVAPDGQSIVFDSYDGVQAPGDVGNLACSDSVEFPIIVTAPNASQINLDEFVVGTRGGPCQEANYRLAYAGNTATFSGAFGVVGFCRANGSLTLTTDAGGLPVEIIPNP